MLRGKKIVLGVTGSIAAYKSANLASLLVKSNACVQVVMTKNATRFISPLTFESLTKNRCEIDEFQTGEPFIKHIALAQNADCLLVAPATANFLAKVAHGIADDLLTSVFLACRAPKIIAPAMNDAMFDSCATQENLSILKTRGIEIAEPKIGNLACGTFGRGKLSPENEIAEQVFSACTKKDLNGKKILVTAGPTRENLDPVRFLTNHSSGKMGTQIARAAAFRGAQVFLVLGAVPSSLVFLKNVQIQKAESALEMQNVVLSKAQNFDCVIMAAAVADFRPKNFFAQKMKKHDFTNDEQFSLALEKTCDILFTLGEMKKKSKIFPFLCGFSMESENLVENSKKKLLQKNLDMICANSLTEENSGFGTDTNHITIIKNDKMIELKLMTKFDAANRILDEIFCTNL